MTLKAVIHIDFADTQRHQAALRNVQNIISGATESPQLRVVCHGPGLALLLTEDNPNAAEVSDLLRQQVSFLACENTLDSESRMAADLITGVQTVPSGAIEVIARQHQGYAYFRP